MTSKMPVKYPMHSYQTERYLRKISNGRSKSPDTNEGPFEVNTELQAHFNHKANKLKEEWQLIKKTLSRCYSNCSQVEEPQQTLLRNFTSAFGFHKLNAFSKPPTTKISQNNSLAYSCDCSHIYNQAPGIPILNESYDIINPNISAKPLHNKLNALSINHSVIFDEYEAGSENISANKVLSSTPAKNMLNCSMAAPISVVRNLINEYTAIGKQQMVEYALKKWNSNDTIKHINKVTTPRDKKVDKRQAINNTIRNQYFACGKPCNSSMLLNKKNQNKENKMDSRKDFSLNSSKLFIKDIKGLPLLSISKIIKNREEAHQSEMENRDCYNKKEKPIEFIIACKAVRNKKALKQSCKQTFPKSTTKRK